MQRNPAAMVDSPRLQPIERAVWNVDIINRFRAAARGSRYYPIYEAALLTGMRRGELCGLRINDLDLAGGRLTVANTAQQVTGAGLVQGPPKTRSSCRTVMLGPLTVELFRNVLAARACAKTQAGEFWRESSLVFTQRNGKPLWPNRVSQEFASIVARNGLPRISLHDLRHAHATLMMAIGVHLKVVSERLGHTSIAMTADIYSHVLPGLQEQAALALERHLAGDA